MASSQHHSHPLKHHLSMPSSNRIAPPGEGIRRKASRSDLGQEMFGQAPGITTPPNVSPLYSGSSSETSLAPHASLLSPSVDIGAHSPSQLSHYESPITTTSAVPTIPLPVPSGFPPRTKHEWPLADTTHHHQAQPEDTRPASGGRLARLWGRLLKFCLPFHALLCIPIRRAAERHEHTTSSRRRSRDKVNNGGDVQPQKVDRDSADGEKAIPTGAPNNGFTAIPSSPDSLDASESTPPISGHLRVIISGRECKEGVHTETITRTVGQQFSADPGSFMPAAQPTSSSPNLVLPRGNTSPEPHLPDTNVSGPYPTICSNPPHLRGLTAPQQQDEQEPHYDQPESGHDISYEPRKNVSESCGGGDNGPT